jgi:excisionase family DNA binding protein
MICVDATMRDMTERPALLTTKALAAALDVHPETIRRWVRAGTIRPTTRTPGKQARWDLDDVRQQLAERDAE